MVRIEGYSGVRKVETHMCLSGMGSKIGRVGSELGPVFKPVRFPPNCPGILREPARKCPRDHQHVNLVGGRAAGAAIYLPGPCRAICRGVAAQLHGDKSGRVNRQPRTSRTWSRATAS